MAKPKKIQNKDGTVSYRIFVNTKLGRESKTFSNQNVATAWAEKRKKEIEYEMVHGKQTNPVIKDLIQTYLERFGATYGRSKNYALNRLCAYPITELTVDKLTTKVIVAHCVERNKEALPQTVSNDVTWLRTVLKSMAAVEGYTYNSAVFDAAVEFLKKEKLIARSRNRERLPTRSEMGKLLRYYRRKRGGIPMYDIVVFAYFSGRRLSEITRLRWDDNNVERKTGMVRDLKHPTMKKGNNRRFKYHRHAWKVVARQTKTSEFIFPFNPKSIGTSFDRTCSLLGINDLHFHDLRHAATTRLFEEGYSIVQVQQFTLHESWTVLKRYTNLQPEDID